MAAPLPRSGRRRWVTEWDADTLVFADPRATARQYTLEFLEEFEALVELVGEHGVNTLVLGSSPKDTPSVWARDFSPLDAGDRLVGFDYRPPYSHEEWDSEVVGRFRDLVAGAIHKPLVRSDLRLECGNIVHDGHTCISTQRLYTLNPARRWGEIRTQLMGHGIERVLALPREAGDEVGHSDGMVRFVGPGAVVINDFRGSLREFGETVLARIPKDLRIVGRAPYHPTSRKNEEGIPSAEGCYTNFLQVGRLVVVPQFGHPADIPARDAIAAVLPDCTVITSRAKNIAREGGVFRCISAHFASNADQSI